MAERAAVARASANVFGGVFVGCDVSGCVTYAGKPSHHLDFAIKRKATTMNEYGQKSRPVYVK